MAAFYALLDEGLDVTRKNPLVFDGTGTGLRQSLLHLAFKANNKEAAAVLLAKGCDPMDVDDFGHLPHHVAAFGAELPVLQWFLSQAPIPLDTKTVSSDPSVDGRTMLLLLLHLSAIKERSVKIQARRLIVFVP
jgi:ankyrin repeat protein